MLEDEHWFWRSYRCCDVPLIAQSPGPQKPQLPPKGWVQACLCLCLWDAGFNHYVFPSRFKFLHLESYLCWFWTPYKFPNDNCDPKPQLEGKLWQPHWIILWSTKPSTVKPPRFRTFLRAAGTADSRWRSGVGVLRRKWIMAMGCAPPEVHME